MTKTVDGQIGDEFDSAIKRLMSSTGLSPAEVMERGLGFLFGRYAGEEGVSETLGLIRDSYEGFASLLGQDSTKLKH